MYFKKFIPQKKKITYKDIAKSKFQTWTWPIWQYILDSTDSFGPRKSWSKNDTAWSLPWFLIFHTLPTLEAGKQASTAGNNQKQTPIVQNPLPPPKKNELLTKKNNQIKLHSPIFQAEQCPLFLPAPIHKAFLYRDSTTTATTRE